MTDGTNILYNLNPTVANFAEFYSSKLRMWYDFRVLEMGCYGLGVSRILQASVEVLTDGKHIRWPKIIAPYQIIIIPQKVTIIIISRRKKSPFVETDVPQ